MSLFIPAILVGVLVSCNCWHKWPQTWWLAKNNTNVLSHRSVGFPGVSNGKESASDAGEVGSIPGSGRSPGGGNGYPLQYSCLENSTDRGAWWTTVHGVAKRWTRLVTKCTHTLFHRSVGLKLEICVTGSKPKPEGLISFWRPQGRICSLPLPPSAACWHSWACGHIIPDSASVFTWPSLLQSVSSLSLLSIYMNTYCVSLLGLPYKISQMGGLDNRNVCLIVLDAGKCKIKVLANFVPG